MAALARSQSSSPTNPALDLFTQVSGVLTDVDSVTFQVFDKSTGTAVQVYPTTPGNKQAVNVDDDVPTGDRLGLGHYLARWTVPSNENLGTHYVKWFIKLTPSSPEQVYLEEFEVLAEVVGASDLNSNYLLVADLREEGYFDTTRYPDSLLQKKIAFASRLIETATKRFFYPKQLTVTIDGRGGPTLLFSDPIISIEYVRPLSLEFTQSELPYFETNEYRVYNRHITQNLTEPDDRDNPKIEMARESWWRYSNGTRQTFARGPQNVEVKGWFGYTDYNGTAKGQTPELIKYAAKLIVRKYLLRVSSGGGPGADRVVSETTRDQSVSYSAPRVGGLITSDPEIDQLLANYYRPPGLGAV